MYKERGVFISFSCFSEFYKLASILGVFGCINNVYRYSVKMLYNRVCGDIFCHKVYIGHLYIMCGDSYDRRREPRPGK